MCTTDDAKYFENRFKQESQSYLLANDKHHLNVTTSSYTVFL